MGIDLSKYAGSYSVEEAREVSKRIGEDIFAAQKKEDLDAARKIYGDNRTYELRKGERVNLRKLNTNERVCASSIKGFHILMTENPAILK